MALGATEPLLAPPRQQRRRRAWGLAVTAVLVLLLFLLSASGPLRPRLFSSSPERVPLTLLAGATEKGAVCLDGTPPGYHLQRGSGDGANKWLVHLEMPTTYVVYKGRVPGVYDDWEDCRRQVHRFSGNSYKGYPTRVEAEGRYARYLAGERRDMRNRMKTMAFVMMVIVTMLVFYVIVV